MDRYSGDIYEMNKYSFPGSSFKMRSSKCSLFLVANGENGF